MRVENVMLEMYSKEGITPEHPMFWAKTLKHFTKCENCTEWVFVEESHNEHGVCLSCYMDRSVQADIQVWGNMTLTFTTYIPSSFSVLQKPVGDIDVIKLLPSLEKRLHEKIRHVVNQCIPRYQYLTCEKCSTERKITDAIIIQSASGPKAYCSNSCLEKEELV